MPIHGYPGNVITANPTAPTVSSASGVWTTEQQLLAVNQGNWPGYEYPISRSLRFNSADTAYLNRTPASATNRKTWTWSAWVKRSVISANGVLLSAGSSGNSNDYVYIDLSASNYLRAQIATGGTQRLNLHSAQVFRDPSAWYHIVFNLDLDNAAQADRFKMYVNGARITSFSTNTNSLDNTQTPQVNNTVAHYISNNSITAGDYFNGYMTEINFIDGQALEPSSFGLNDPETGVWSPKRYTGTYGTNGFYLNFSDNSGTTSTTLGKDYSGNGNNWTPNNFSVTAGAGNDSLVDTPTSYGTDTGAGGEVRGNYATLNPLIVNNKTGETTQTFSNANLQVRAFGDSNGSPFTCTQSTLGVTTNKWYFEVTHNGSGGIGDGNDNEALIGVVNLNSSPNVASGDGVPGAIYTNNGAGYYRSGTVFATGATVNTSGSSYTTGDVIGVALDLTNLRVWFSKNGVWQGTGSPDPSTNTSPNVSSLSSSGVYVPSVANYASSNIRWSEFILNFGQRPFAYTAPSGFKALCTQNLPEPTIKDGGDYFDVMTWTGDGSASKTFSDLSFQPDFVWSKARNAPYSHRLYDAVRGAGSGKDLYSDLTTAEGGVSGSLYGYISAFTSNGFTAINGTDSADAFLELNKTYVAWNWKANGSGSSNTAGTITSTVSANTTSGFSIVTWTGNGSSNQTIGHGLGVTPGMIIVKARTQASATNWRVWHKNLSGSASYLGLNQTAAESISSTVFNGQSSTTFTVGTDPAVNANTYTFVAYCFAPVAGYSAFGSYTGNGSTDGPFVYLGFRPEYLLLKLTNTTGSWQVKDSARNTYNVTDLTLYPNLSNAEASDIQVDFLSNGFKLRSSTGENANGNTVIYAAFAESPFKYALAR